MLASLNFGCVCVCLGDLRYKPFIFGRGYNTAISASAETRLSKGRKVTLEQTSLIEVGSFGARWRSSRILC